jgi:hypothetical protein
MKNVFDWHEKCYITLAQNGTKKDPDSPFCHKDFLECQAQEELGEEAQEDADDE